MKKKTAKKRTAKKKTAKKSVGDQAKDLLRKKSPKKTIRNEDLLSSGCLMIDLACSGSRFGAFAKGYMYRAIGKSSSGKTFITRTCFAEAHRNPNFDGYRFIFDDIEKGSLMDNEFFFGKGASERIEPPAVDVAGDSMHSEIIEDLYFNLADAVEDGRPFIYVADSMDALSSKAEQKKFKKRRAARRSNKPESGEMTDGKAKANSSNMRGIINGLKETGSILILISQTRDAMNTFGFGPKEVSSGGRSLEFYAGLELWLSIRARETKTVAGRKRLTGINSQVRIKKNRIMGQDRTVYVPIMNRYGIDDTLACVRYLSAEEGHWKRNKAGVINAEEFGVKLHEEKLVEYIEQEDLIAQLHLLVEKVWNEIEQKLVPDRDRRYA